MLRTAFLSKLLTFLLNGLPQRHYGSKEQVLSKATVRSSFSEAPPDVSNQCVVLPELQASKKVPVIAGILRIPLPQGILCPLKSILFTPFFSANKFLVHITSSGNASLSRYVI